MRGGGGRCEAAKDERGGDGRSLVRCECGDLRRVGENVVVKSVKNESEKRWKEM